MKNRIENDETSEQVRLLNNLAKEELNVHQVRQETIMQSPPTWNRLESVGLINNEEAALLTKLHDLSLEQIDNLLHNNENIVKAMMKVLYYHSSPKPSQYILTLLYELVRDNSSRYDFLIKCLQDYDSFGALRQIIYNSSADSYSADRAAFLISSFMCRHRSEKLNESDIKYFINTLGQQDSKQSNLTENGKMDALINILNYPPFRMLAWNDDSTLKLIKRCLLPHVPSNLQYRGMFCVWLLSFEHDLLSGIHENEIDTAICEIIKENRKEKIVRVFIKTSKNLMLNDDCVEVFIDKDIFRILTLLEYEKWRDSELYDDIRDGKFHLDKKIKTFSNFGRYCNELDKKVLKWSILHSEKFWRENVMSFEQDEFAAIRKLFSLLNSNDTQTQSIVCYDLGEFARFHPAGKKICQKFKIKDAVLLFIDHHHRDVAREALLCLQKLMLNNWQDVSTAIPKS